MVKRKRRKKPVRKRMRKSKPVSTKRTVQNLVTMVTMMVGGQALKRRTIVSIGGTLVYKLGMEGCLLLKERDAVTQ